jgi:hypothetical protein
MNNTNKRLVKSQISELRNSDFFVSDDKMKFRLIGLKWIEGVDVCPVVSFVSSPLIHDFQLTKQIIFMIGKKIYCNNKFSARLSHLYSVGELLGYEEDLKEAAILYSKFLYH